MENSDQEAVTVITERTFNDVARYAKERGFKYHEKQKEMLAAAVREAYELGQRNPIEQSPVEVSQAAPVPGAMVVQFLIGEDFRRGRVLFKIVAGGVGRIFPLQVPDALRLSENIAEKARSVLAGPKPTIITGGKS